jgi:ribosomal protein S18 acetylase RimI-like enzyme
MSTATLRRATIADLPLIFRGERAYMTRIEPEHEARWLDALERNLAVWIKGLGRTLVAEVAGEPAGYLAWTTDGDAALLTTIHVFDAFRRQGLGATLLRAYISDARTFGLERLTLDVHPDNPARRMYEDAGFEFLEERGDYLLYARRTDPQP